MVYYGGGKIRHSLFFQLGWAVYALRIDQLGRKLAIQATANAFIGGHDLLLLYRDAQPETMLYAIANGSLIVREVFPAGTAYRSTWSTINASGNHFHTVCARSPRSPGQRKNRPTTHNNSTHIVGRFHQIPYAQQTRYALLQRAEEKCVHRMERNLLHFRTLSLAQAKGHQDRCPAPPATQRTL